MSKRRFRTAPPRLEPAYPTTEIFERSGRRDFLTRLGGALLGAGAIATGLAACGSRAVGDPDLNVMMGDPAQPDAGIDALINVHPPGTAPLMVDAGPEWGVDGDVAQPDAAIDDGMWWAGGKPGPGTKLDGGSCPNP